MSSSLFSDYPVRLEVEYPESPSRGMAFLGVIFPIKALLLIPHAIIIYFLGIIAGFVVYIGYWAVLITGRCPEGLFNFTVGVSRWQMRTIGWLYGWTDRYPPFSLK